MQSNKKNSIKNDEFIDNVQKHKMNIEETSKKEGWVFKYDDVSDILYFFNPLKKMNSDSVMIPVSEACVSLMVTKNGAIEGITIEDFIEYYVTEHKEYDKLADVVLKKKNEIIKPYKEPKNLGIFGKCILLAVKEPALCTR